MGGFQGYDLSGSEMFFDEGFTSFHLCWVERVDLGDLGGKVQMEFNGMIIGVMGRKLVVGFLREDIHEVVAPFRYDQLC